jgi:hypothetical protein
MMQRYPFPEAGSSGWFLNRKHSVVSHRLADDGDTNARDQLSFFASQILLSISACSDKLKTVICAQPRELQRIIIGFTEQLRNIHAA